MLNNVLGTLKYDITGAALSLVVTPLAGTSFNLPPGGTDASGVTTGGVATFGKPVETLILADRLDLSQAKFEIVQCTTRVPEAAGAYTHTVLAGGRGAEGSVATAWTAGNTVYVFQATTAALLDLLANGWAMRAQSMLVHYELGILSWDGTTFKYTGFRALGNGRGVHASSDGFMDIGMPANGSVAVGYGGAANCVAASGGWPLVPSTTLFYEPNLAGTLSVTTAANFRVVGYTSNFVVPPHWIMIATRPAATGGDGLRLGNGAHLPYWHPVGGAGEPAFQNAWANYGGGYQAAQFSKSDDGWVNVRGLIGAGTATAGTVIFTLPAGFRPAAPGIFSTQSGDVFACLGIAANGNITIRAGINTSLTLDIRFQAAG